MECSGILAGSGRASPPRGQGRQQCDCLVARRFAGSAEFGHALKLFADSVVNFSPILNKEDICRALRQPLDLVAVFAHLPRCQLAACAWALERKRRAKPLTANLHMATRQVALLTTHDHLHGRCLRQSDLRQPLVAKFVQ